MYATDVWVDLAWALQKFMTGFSANWYIELQAILKALFDYETRIQKHLNRWFDIAFIWCNVVKKG